MHEFKSAVKLDTLSNLKALTGYEIDYVNTEHVDIKWTLEFDIRSWGIKDAVVSVPIQTIYIEFETLTPESDSIKKVEFEVKLQNVDVKLNGKLPSEPSSLEYDGKKWVLEF